MAIISKTHIANLALSLVHTKGIEDIDAEDNTEATTAKLWYDVARLEVLEAFNWNFARHRETLAAHPRTPPDEWAYRYVWPSDCVAARLIENPAGANADPVPFDIEQSDDGDRSILADLESAKLIYTRDVETVSLFSPHFITTFAHRLAWYMAGTLTRKQTLQKSLLSDYQVALATAASLDANQGVGRMPRQASWIEGR